MIYRCRDMIYLLHKHDIRTRPADKIKDFERLPRNLVIRFAHNNIRSFIREAYIICEADIIASAISSVATGNGYHCKKPLLSGRQKRFFTWLRTV